MKCRCLPIGANPTMKLCATACQLLDMTDAEYKKTEHVL